MPYSPTGLLKSASQNLGVDFPTPFCFESPCPGALVEMALVW
jgi:hypothetical protein